jgi:glycerophosphoryl diester phosphodiesterase
MRVIAHRGARLLAVENTLDALRLAFEEGAEGVEFDVQLSADHEPVLFHDDDLRALAGREGPVGALRWRELRGLELRDRRGRHGRVPHLDEALELLGRQPGLHNLELKVVGASAARLGEVVAARLSAQPARGWCVSSFDGEALRRFVRAGGRQPVAALVDARGGDFAALAGRGPAAMAAVAQACQRLGPTLAAVHPHHAHVDGARMTLWAAAGWQVRAWTVNEPRGWAALAEAGAHACISDDPGALRAWRDRVLGGPAETGEPPEEAAR